MEELLLSVQKLLEEHELPDRYEKQWQDWIKIQTESEKYSKLEPMITCPISLNVMHLPCLGSDNHLYDFQSLKTQVWKVSPMTRESFGHYVKTCSLLRHVIECCVSLKMIPELVTLAVVPKPCTNKRHLSHPHWHLLTPPISNSPSEPQAVLRHLTSRWRNHTSESPFTQPIISMYEDDDGMQSNRYFQNFQNNRNLFMTYTIPPRGEYSARMQ